MSRTRAEREAEAQAAVREVTEWNRRHPVGTPVRYWPGAREGPGAESQTRSEAFLISGHASVQVDGKPGSIALSHVEAVVVTCTRCNGRGAPRGDGPHAHPAWCPDCNGGERNLWLVYTLTEPGHGSVLLWWKANRCGYTAKVDEAGRYTRAEAEEIERLRGQEVAVPLAEVEAHTVRVVYIGDLPDRPAPRGA